MALSITHTPVYCTDLDEALAFYTQRLGFEVRDDVPMMARAALMSPSLFSRRFREAYGDTPYGYLQARRVERAMALLRNGHMSVTDVCLAVGFTSLGSFSSTFTRLVGEPPSVYRARDHSRLTRVPPCMTRAWARPRWVEQPCRIGEAFRADRP